MDAETRACKNCKKDFTIESDDFAFYKKIGVPAPTWCPHCRFIRKITFINERFLYKRNCGNCGASMISMYHPGLSVSVWCLKCHISDAWDARDYGRDYDFSRNFFEQFKELMDSTPHRTLDQNERNTGNCEYSNFCFTSKDVYLSFQIAGSEIIKYSRHAFKQNKNCLDCLIFKANERGYELVSSSSNYNSSFLIESDQCVESHFLYDCSNCVNCCMSSNIRNKSYIFRNKQLTKEEYQNAVTEMKLGTYFGQLRAKEEFTQMAKGAIHKYAHIKNSVNTIGDFIENSKNIRNSYGLVDAENSKNIFIAMNQIRDCYDMVFVGKLEECYEMTDAGRSGSRIVFSQGCGGGSKNIFYCNSCRGCSDCFGCVGLNKKQYCIFNKQYSKGEYEKMIGRIKVHMDEMPYIDKAEGKYKFGEYFPSEISPFAYNETIAFEEEPKTKETILSLGFKWREPEKKSYIATISSDALPDSIKDVADSICGEIVECMNQGKIETQCTSAFKVLPDELQFYRQMNLPVPRYCPNCRYHQRLVWKNPFRFYKRGCMCELSGHSHKARCPNEFETMYAPERPEKIYCKECYQKEVY